jgi:hypothetical protein
MLDFSELEVFFSQGIEKTRAMQMNVLLVQNPN